MKVKMQNELTSKASVLRRQGGKATRQNSKRFKTFHIMALTLLLAVPFAAGAKVAPPRIKKAPVKAPVFEVAGWIPYWKATAGSADATAHLDELNEISPFAYSVKNNGNLVDTMRIDKEPWYTLINTARAKKVKIIPSVMWNNADAIDAVLKNPKLRKVHVNEIANVVLKHGFEGIDIDYEGKKAETKDSFSLFLRDLHKALKKKLLSCTIEARTPLDSRFCLRSIGSCASNFEKIPEDIRYANDFAKINSYCDRVRIMAYDQGTADLKLNQSAQGPYVPVADPKWVEKVIALAAQSIAKQKIVIGVPTYGYEFEATPLLQGYRYGRLWAFNPKYALDVSGRMGVAPQRNEAGELSFLYTPTATSTAPQSGDTPQPAGIAFTAPPVPLTNATSTPSGPLPRLLWWSDASAIGDKVALAKKLGVRGIAIFKIDGGEDPGIWDHLR